MRCLCAGPLGGHLFVLGFFYIPELSPTLADGIPTEFYRQILCGQFFLALVFQTGKFNMGVRPLASQEETVQLRYSWGFSTTTCGYKVSPFHDYVCPSYHTGFGFFCVPWLQDFSPLVFIWLLRLIAL